MIETLKLEKQDHENKTHKEEKTKSERRQPIDMKLFWKNLDETYFKNPKDLNTEKINHLIMNLSTYGNSINCLYLYRLKK